MPRRRFRRAAAAILTTFGLFAGPALTDVLPSPTAAAAPAEATNSADLADRAGEALGVLDRATQSRRPSVYRRYLVLRNEVATRSARALGVDPGAMRAAWSRTDQGHQVAVLAAISQLGVPYRTHSAVEGQGFDCSGLTRYAWDRAGHDIVHQSAGQLNASVPLDRESARAGDLVEYPGHVMMYLGVGDAIVHAPHSGKTVELSTIASGRSVRFGDPTP